MTSSTDPVALHTALVGLLEAMEYETTARQAEEVAVELVRHASALTDWAFETRYTDPDPTTLPAVAEALEASARALRDLAARG